MLEPSASGAVMSSKAPPLLPPLADESPDESEADAVSPSEELHAAAPSARAIKSATRRAREAFTIPKLDQRSTDATYPKPDVHQSFTTLRSPARTPQARANVVHVTTRPRWVSR